MTLAGHLEDVTGVAITPDGQNVVSASEDKTIRVWDLANGRELRTLAGHTSTVTGVAVTPDGRSAISTSEDTTLRVWDLATGSSLAVLEAHAPLLGCAVAPDGRTFLAGDGAGSLHILDWIVAVDDLTSRSHLLDADESGHPLPVENAVLRRAIDQVFLEADEPGHPWPMPVENAVLRRAIKQVIRTDSDLDAFCLDYFQDIYRRFTNGMDGVQKVNVILEHADHGELQAALLRAYPLEAGALLGPAAASRMWLPRPPRR